MYTSTALMYMHILCNVYAQLYLVYTITILHFLSLSLSQMIHTLLLNSSYKLITFQVGI